MEKSKFFSLKSKKKKEDVVETPALTEVEVSELLATVEESIETIKEVQVESLPEVEEVVEVIKETQATKKAYNIWQHPETKAYMLDTIEYDADSVISFNTKQLGLSQAMAMYEIKRIFTQKLILKRGGM